MNKAKDHQIVYNLSIAEGLDIILPNALICDTDADNQPGYMRAFALHETIASYHIAIRDTAHATLLQLCKELTIQAIETNFNKNQKKKRNLQSLFADVQIRKLVQASIDRRMITFLQIIRDHQFPICYDLQRKIKASQVRLNFFEDKAIPRLLFVKTMTGIKYTLTLTINDNIILPKAHNINIITDHPATFIIDQHIVWLEHLNAAKVKPFFKNDSVFIPEKLTKDYFRQFITDVMGKVEIEVEGFDLIKVDNISRKILRFVYDIFARRWVIDLVFEYDDFRFSHSDAGKHKTKILFESDNISVFQSTRNIAEEQLSADILKEAKCIQTETKKFICGQGEFDVLHYIGLMYPLFSANFTI
ncbi:MAG: hypothetical protein IPO92_22065 [Saprospiraceae bacterium]|nr:hypothetical protein [Saprospiraceae bacterium]